MAETRMVETEFSMGSGAWRSPAARRWALSELRRRWRQLVLLGVMAGITCGLAVAAYDGASRTDTALDRFLDRTAAADVVVFATQAGVLDPDWTQLRAQPEVDRFAAWGLLFGAFDGKYEPNQPLFVSIDGTFTSEIDRPIVVEGRMYDPAAPDEIVIHEIDRELTGLDIGDVIHFQAAATIEEEFGAAPISGPVTDLKIVGIVHSPWEFLFTGGGAFLSPGYIATYGDQAFVLPNAVLTVRPGTSEEQIRSVVGQSVQPGVPVLDLRSVARRAQTSLGVEQAILLAIGAAIAAVGAVLIAQAVIRSAADAAADAPAFRAMGMTTPELVAAPMLAHALAAALTVPIAVATALIASRWLPVGLASRLDPDRGVQASPVMAVAAAVVVGMLMLVVAGLAARATLAPRPVAARRGSVAGVARRVRPLAVRLGCTMAFEPRVGRRSTGSRAALVGAVAALIGVAGAITLTRGVSDAAGHPERAGVVADAEFSVAVEDPANVRPADRLVDTLVAQPGVTAAVPVLRFPSDISGLAVPTFGFGDRIVGDDIEPIVVEGRRPSSDGEVALGPATADVLGVALGDEIALQDGRTATVVGLALFPTDVHSRFDEGLVTTWNRSIDLVDASEVGLGATALTVAVRLATGRDQAGVDVLAAALDGQVEAGVQATGVPPEIDNLQRIRRLPLAVAAFLLVLGVAAVGYGLASSVRRRRRDIAVWRALGMTTGNARTAVLAEATTIALVGTVVGVPVGIVVGRLSWKAISDRIPLAFVAPLAVGALALVVAIAFVLANVLAILPGRHAARLRPAAVLRAE